MTAVRDGTADLSAVRTGESHSIIVIVTNRGGQPLQPEVPRGLIVLSSEARGPDMVVHRIVCPLRINDADPRERLYVRAAGPWTVPSGSRAAYLCQAFSVEQSRTDHVPGTGLGIGDVDPLLGHVLDTIGRLAPEAPDKLVQAALWALTDGLGSEDTDVSTRELFDILFWLDRAGMNRQRLPLAGELDDRLANLPGQQAKAGDVIVRLLTVRRSMRLNALEPARGEQFVLVTIELRTDGHETLYEADFSLRDDRGCEYGPSPLSGKFPAGFRTRVELAGRPYVGTLVFEVPLGAKGFTLRHGDGDRYFECRGET